MGYDIPFNRPSLVGTEFDYIKRAIDLGRISGDGVFTRRCEALLEDALGVEKVLLTPSCTDALEMAALLLDVQPGDEVIVPSFTFPSTANAFVLRGARPVFADIRSDTLNLDESRLEALVTPRTRAVVPVHYAGVGCEMHEIMALAERHGLAVVEDNAHGLFGRYRGRTLGSFGAMGAQSFHETKNINCGEGGALLINASHLIDRAHVLREKGTNRTQFFRGEVDKYTWVDVGSSFLTSEVVSAFLLAQLEARDAIQERRRTIWHRYDDALPDWAAENGVRRPVVPAHCDQAYHLYYLVMPSLAARTALINHLKAAGILAVFHYLPLHLSPMGLRFGGKAGRCPVTEDISDRLVRLPFYNSMTDEEQERVIASIQACCIAAG